LIIRAATVRPAIPAPMHATSYFGTLRYPPHANKQKKGNRYHCGSSFPCDTDFLLKH
jgi:hypothetical protein